MSTVPSPTDARALSDPLGDAAGRGGGHDGGADERDRARSPHDAPARPPRGLNAGGADPSNREARRREADEDRELIGLAQKGDHAAFRRLVERHQRRAFVLALGLVHDEDDARELVQEAFLRVYRGLGAFQGTSSFFTWLYRIVHNLAIDHLRKPGRHDTGFDEEDPAVDQERFPMVSRIDGADPMDVLRRREIARRIQAAVDALPPYHRGVILMREVEGMSHEQMAQAMGVSPGTIMSRLYHARMKLQRALADCYADDADDSPPPEEEVT